LGRQLASGSLSRERDLEIASRRHVAASCRFFGRLVPSLKVQHLQACVLLADQRLTGLATASRSLSDRK